MLVICVKQTVVSPTFWDYNFLRFIRLQIKKGRHTDGTSWGLTQHACFNSFNYLYPEIQQQITQNQMMIKKTMRFTCLARS